MHKWFVVALDLLQIIMVVFGQVKEIIFVLRCFVESRILNQVSYSWIYTNNSFRICKCNLLLRLGLFSNLFGKWDETIFFGLIRKRIRFLAWMVNTLHSCENQGFFGSTSNSNFCLEDFHRSRTWLKIIESIWKAECFLIKHPILIEVICALFQIDLKVEHSFE